MCKVMMVAEVTSGNVGTLTLALAQVGPVVLVVPWVPCWG